MAKSRVHHEWIIKKIDVVALVGAGEMVESFYELVF